jgi:multiple sugar transport system permease protein
MRAPATRRFLIYACLGFAALVIGTPMLRMACTALLPGDQTRQIPPHWLPRAFYATLEGRRIEVILGTPVAGDGFWVIDAPAPDANGAPHFIPAAEYRDAAGQRVLKSVAAGWIPVAPRVADPDGPGADILPASAIETRIRPRWENFPLALASMAGQGEATGGGTEGDRHVEIGRRAGFRRFATNTLIICILSVLGTIVSNSIVAYGFACLRWRGRDAFFGLTLATMMVPFPVLMVPLFGVFKNLGMIGTLVPLWLPAFFGNGFFIFLMRQFFRTIPGDIAESARIDGCSEWAIFWRIILPLCRPVLAVAALFQFLWAWNDFLGPLLFLHERPLFTLSLALQQYQTQHGGMEWHLLMAATVVTTLPLIVLFLLTQRTFVQGIATTGLKG